MQAHGINVTHDALQNVRGASKREIIRRFVEKQFPENAARHLARTEEIFSAFRQRLSEIYSNHGIKEIAGTTETFAWLRRRHSKIALNTGFDRELTALILQNVAWDTDFVQAVICGDDVAQGRPAPYLIFHAMEAAGVIDVARVANVGDTVLDLQAGHNAGVHWNLGVLSGAHRQEQLEKFPHTHLLPSVAALPALWS